LGKSGTGEREQERGGPGEAADPERQSFH